jgi:uncharacterized protein YdhG (YjbR/CyaY superfamily)
MLLIEGDVDYYGTVEPDEVENVRVLHEKFSKELEMFKRSFNVMVEGVLDAHNKFAFSPAPMSVKDFAIALVSAKFIRSSKAALNLLLNGYLYEAYILWRTMLEDILRLNCFLKDEKSASDWLKGKLKVRKTRRIAQELSLDENFRQLYSWLSDYVHTNPQSFGLIFEVENEKATLKISPTLPKSTKDQITIIIVPIAFNFIFLTFIKQAYGEKIEKNVRDKIEQLIIEISPYLKF